MRPLSSFASFSAFVAPALPRFALLASLAAPLSLAAQSTGIVTGRVTGPDGNAIAAAAITVTGTSLTATTDRSGVFTLVGVPAGRQSLTIRSIGKKPVTQTVSVAAGGRTPIGHRARTRAHDARRDHGDR